MSKKAQYHFFAYMARMKLIRRWGLMRSVTQENIAEHSAQVAHIAHAIALIKNKKFGGDLNADRISTIALYHETSEVITGDLPTPIKYYNAEIRNSYKDIERAANEKLIATLPEEFREDYREIIEVDSESYEHKIVKAADKIAAYVKAIEEMQRGNREFAMAEKALEREVLDCAENMPEVAYFCECYLDGFKKTLDELE
jgi:5'-deoxynucleotidase